jgi:transcription elongation GreA/GreB family factor
MQCHTSNTSAGDSVRVGTCPQPHHVKETTMGTTTTTRTENGERAGRPQLTREGADLLAAHATDIRERRLAELRPLLVEHERDERHVAEFEQLLAQADEWDRFLASAQIIAIDPADFDGHVALGVRVKIRLVDKSAAWVRLVHPREAVLDEERISVTSPLGIALLGAAVKDKVTVSAPAGDWVCSVLEVDASGVIATEPKRRRFPRPRKS